MRFSSLLPVLLLLASPLTAQPNCSIFDLTATVAQFDPTTCQFFVVLNFGHTGTTNQFTVSGNGTNYGTFLYNQVPLPLGPFTASNNATTILEFKVQDAVLQDCFDQIVIEVPPCSGTVNCDISDLIVDVGDCHPATGTYTLTVGFQVTNPGNGLFELWAGNNVQLGTFPLADLPLTIPNFPWSGGAMDILKVCINDQPNCCESIEFPAPNCFNQGCGLLNLIVDTGDCLSDSTYKAFIDFDLLNPTITTDSFHVFLDGAFYGTYGLNQLPLPVIFETNGSAHHSVVKICIDLPQNLTCCLEEEFTVPTCFSPCAIQDFHVDVDSCTSDSTFGIWVNFQVADSTAVDSFNLWGNGQLLGHFGMDQLPLNITDFEWNGLIFNSIKVCTGNDPACCKELQFLAPACLPFDTCEVTNIFVHTGPCTSDSTYQLTLNFNATNPGNGTFIVWANGVVLDTFDLTQAPITIPNFPWDGGANDVVRVCIGGNNVPGTSPNGCCESKEFPVPQCLGICDIFDLHVDAGDCDPNTNTYPLVINFGVVHPGNNFFDVWANGAFLGTFPLSQLPLTIPNYQASGNQVDVVRVCIGDHPDCCAQTEFETPDCTVGDCHIFDLTLQVGDCNPAGGYHLTVNFGVTNPGNDSFDVWANGQLFGTYPLNQLPLHIPNFPGSGNAIDHIKICINDNPNCCTDKEFQAPNCNNDCHIFDLTLQVGDCNPLGGYHLTVNFGVTNPGNDSFDVWANGQLFGTYPLSQLPLHIPNFPDNGNAIDHIKICINDHPDCCIGKEFQAPNCNGDCHIFDLSLQVGDCNPLGGYHLTVNFGVDNPGNDFFNVWANGQFFGTFPLNQLPLHIPNFPDNGNAIDHIKICINDNPDCCIDKEFQAPNCNGLDCDIYDLVVDTGNCTSDSTYQVTFNFQVTNPPGNVFGLWANGQFVGMFGLGQLPLTIPNFPWNGGNNDLIKVCFSNAPGTTGSCCAELEFPVPGCLTNNNDCEIFNMVVDPGTCTSDSTYSLVVNFQVQNPPSPMFNLWANGVLFGTYNLNQLPLTIPNFPWNGGNNDVVKVCSVNPNGLIECCKTLEFLVPDCLDNGGDCEIFGMVVDPGDCTSDSTYSLFLNFQVQNPPGNIFGVWANGVFQGTFNLNQLPLNFPNFPWDGGNNDVVKVCFLDNSGATSCCRTLEFEVPGCLGNNDCHIWDVFAVRTGCLCGQFFVAITFNHDNGSNGGFDLVGNGTLYGTYPYNTAQPIILGPFPGDGSTVYEFGVVDHLHPDCEDGFVLGVVTCDVPVVEPGTPSSLVISPNPASNWVNVTAMLENGTNVGQATVNVYHADGRLVQTQVIANAANFPLDVSNLPAGVYRLSIQAGSGRLEGSFSKQ